MKIPKFVLNFPNILSVGRVFLIPLFLYLLFLPTMKAKIWALILFMLASLADLIDGWAARKLNQETEFGKFFDPLADKILVISALVALLLLDPLIPFWMIFIIVARDILITMMRSMALKKNKPLRTSRFGKIKTAFQMGSIVIIIMILIIKKSGFINEKLYSYLNHNSISFFSLGSVLELINSDLADKWIIVAPYWIMLIVTCLTAFSGLRYLYTNWHLFSFRVESNSRLRSKFKKDSDE